MNYKKNNYAIILYAVYLEMLYYQRKYIEKKYFSAGYRDFLPNVHFSFEVIRQRKLGKTMIEEVHFIVKTIKV